MIICFDVDLTLLAHLTTACGRTRQVLRALSAEGHGVYVWSACWMPSRPSASTRRMDPHPNPLPWRERD